jgi:hypothetical protein
MAKRAELEKRRDPNLINLAVGKNGICSLWFVTWIGHSLR